MDDDIKARLVQLEDFSKRWDRRIQMGALASAYMYYQVRNSIIEARIKGELTGGRKVRIYYYAYILDQLSYPLIFKLNEDDKFDLVMLAEEPAQVEFLRSRGLSAYIVHSKYEKHPDFKQPSLSNFNADICFGEMPYGVLPSLEESIVPSMVAGNWLPNYRDIFPLNELNNSLFCFVHYAYFLADEWIWLKSNPDLNVHYSLPYANFCWLYFLESVSHLEFALRRNSFGNTTNYVVTGYPKYDAYLEAPQKPQGFNWIHPDGERKRVVYAPHFKRSDATLTTTCEALLAMADSGRYEIIFKPHPVYNKTVNDFAPKFEAHADCQMIRNSDSSQYIFSTADIAIISSVSMHADGLFSGKPYISELSEQNFNHIGKEIRSAAYMLDEFTDLRGSIERILFEGDDPKKEERDRIRAILATPGSSATNNIIAAISNRLLPV